jgi:hypothetical protein
LILGRASALRPEGERLLRSAMSTAEVSWNRTEVLTAWGDWLHAIGGWQWFVTLTLRDPKPSYGNWTKPGFALANRAWDDFIKFSHEGLDVLQWVRFFELQRERGVPHIHGLVKGLASTRYSQVSEIMWQRYGFNRILDYKPELGATHYITKYVVKDLGDVRFSDRFDVTTPR